MGLEIVSAFKTTKGSNARELQSLISLIGIWIIIRDREWRKGLGRGMLILVDFPLATNCRATN